MKLDPKQVKAKIKMWQGILKLEPLWNVSFKIRNSAMDMSEGNEDAMACIAVDLRYFMAEIEFNSPEIEEGDLDCIILHELLHIILEPIAISSGCGLGEDYEEMNSVLTESTIERLMPGYLGLFEKAYGIKTTNNKATTKKSATRSIRCKHKS